MKTGRENIELQISHPNYGKVIKSSDGMVVCHICGEKFRKLGAHIVQKHDMTSWQYKVMFGLDVGKGLISDEHKQYLHDCVKRNYDVCVAKNLIEGGVATRYAPNSNGRTREFVSEQTLQRLINQGKIKNAKSHKKHEKKIHRGKQ